MERNGKGRYAIIILGIIVLLICGVLIYRNSQLQKKLDEGRAQLALVNEKIEEAKLKTDEIRSEIIYRQTDDYIEDEARELGLVYPDEIIIVPEE